MSRYFDLMFTLRRSQELIQEHADKHLETPVPGCFLCQKFRVINRGFRELIEEQDDEDS